MYRYSFKAAIESHDIGSDQYRYTVVYVPDDVLDKLPLKKHPRLRINGVVNDYEIEAALNPSRGLWYIMLSKRVLKAIGASGGEVVTVKFNVADQNAVKIPPELQDALAKHAAKKALWDELTPGKQRGWAHRINIAKTKPTKLKRIDELLDALGGGFSMRGKGI